MCEGLHGSDVPVSKDQRLDGSFYKQKIYRENITSLDSHRHMSAIHVQGLDDSAGPFCLRRAKQVPYWLGRAADADRNPLPDF